MIDFAEPVPNKWPILGERSDRLELPIQIAFRRAMRLLAPCCRVVAIPNGTHIASQAGRAKANAEGRSIGFPDVAVLWTGGVAFIEFKAGRSGSVSDAQSEWLTWLDRAGFPCCVSRNEHHAIQWLREIGAPVAAELT